MNFAKNVRVVDLSSLSQDQLNQYLEYLIMLDAARVKAIQYPKTWNPRVEGILSLGRDLINLTKLSEIPVLPEGNVPLYCFPSTRTAFVNGKVSQIVGEVNILSLGVLKANRNTAITDQIKTPSIIPLKMFTEFVTTATLFGTLRMIRITIPKILVNTNQDQQTKLI